MMPGHSRWKAVLLSTSYIHNLCGVINVCLLLHFFYKINYFLDNYKPGGDILSETDDSNLNSTFIMQIFCTIERIKNDILLCFISC